MNSTRGVRIFSHFPLVTVTCSNPELDPKDPDPLLFVRIRILPFHQQAKKIFFQFFVDLITYLEV
jgi:hypothetical protein